jgi:hypothetical protein
LLDVAGSPGLLVHCCFSSASAGDGEAVSDLGGFEAYGMEHGAGRCERREVDAVSGADQFGDGSWVGVVCCVDR